MLPFFFKPFPFSFPIFILTITLFLVPYAIAHHPLRKKKEKDPEKGWEKKKNFPNLYVKT